MGLEELIESGLLDRKSPTKNEIKKLVEFALRRLDDARNETVHTDARYEQAYNAILACATICLKALSLRVRKRDGHHLLSMDSLRFTLELEDKTADYLQTVRRKRNKALYEEVFTYRKANYRN